MLVSEVAEAILSELMDSLYPSLSFVVRVGSDDLVSAFEAAGLDKVDRMLVGNRVETSMNLFDLCYQYNPETSLLDIVIDLDPARKRSDFYFSALKNCYDCIITSIKLLENSDAVIVSVEGTESLMRFLMVCAKSRNIATEVADVSGVDEVFGRTKGHLNDWFSRVKKTDLPLSQPDSYTASIGGSGTNNDDQEV